MMEPAKNVRIATQLIQGTYGRVLFGQLQQEIAHSAAVLTSRIISETGGERGNGLFEHFTPTYSSWLNQVEIWFSKIQRDVIERGIFTSLVDLKRKLMRYIKSYAKIARPIRWTYCDVKRRITAY